MAEVCILIEIVVISDKVEKFPLDMVDHISIVDTLRNDEKMHSTLHSELRSNQKQGSEIAFLSCTVQDSSP